MEIGNKKYIVIAVGVVVAVLAIVAWQMGWLGGLVPGGDVMKSGPKAGEVGAPGAPLGEDTFRPENPEALGTVEGGTRETIKNEVKTPEKDDTSASADVAIPTNVVQTGPSALRQFDMKGDGGKYVPSTLVVNEGDVINLNFTAVDADYNVFFPDFGVFRTFSRGSSGTVQFQGYPFGEYEFYCKDVCGSKNVRGKLIVNKK